MKNFFRVLQLSLRYRWTLIASGACALLVAVLWGANIGTAWPIVQVAISGQSLQEWADNELTKSRAVEAEYRALLTGLEREAAQADAPNAELIRRIRRANERIVSEQKAQERFAWLKPIFDRYLPLTPFRTVMFVTVMIVVGTFIKDIFLICNSILVERLAQLAAFDLRKLFYRRTLRMDVDTFGDDGTSDLMSRFTHDIESVTYGIGVLYGKLIREPLKALACLIGAAFICWRLLIFSLVLAPVAALLIRWLGRMLKRANRRAMEEMALIYAKLEETFRGIKIVKAFTNEAEERRRFHEGSKEYYRKSMRIAGYDSLAHPLTEILGVATISLALLAGAWLVLKGETHLLGIRMVPRRIDLPSLLIFYGMLLGVADPLRKFSDVFNRLQRAIAAADRIYDRLDREPLVADPPRPLAVQRHCRDIVFENVSFAYRPGQMVLRDVNLRIPFGQTVAIVGPNGCGKSTLANLLLRFYDPTAGRILLDGVPLTDMRLRDLRGQIGLVTQETLLFDDTVYNNIRYGALRASREQVIEAAQKAHAHEFIEKHLVDGYETEVGTLGGRLSGGQRQRISLARAILRDPSLIILDEATSQVDLESEQAIQEALEEFIQNRTAVIITHRMAVLALADQIVVMQAGQILDVGSHAELLARCPFYRRLYQIQFEDRPDQIAA